MKITSIFKTCKNHSVGALVLFCLAVTNLPHADDELASLKSLLPQSCFLAGGFQQQKQLPDIPRPLSSTGRFIFNCQQGLIWSTEQPHRETLVYRRDGNHHILIPGNETERLKGRIHRELGKILNNLIGADLKYLHEHFTTSTSTKVGHRLIPNNKRLRKYIASITIARVPEGTQIVIIQNEEENIAITITETQTLAELNRRSCSEGFPEYAAACALLFQ